MVALPNVLGLQFPSAVASLACGKGGRELYLETTSFSLVLCNDLRDADYNRWNSSGRQEMHLVSLILNWHILIIKMASTAPESLSAQEGHHQLQPLPLRGQMWHLKQRLVSLSTIGYAIQMNK